MQILEDEHYFKALFRGGNVCISYLSETYHHAYSGYLIINIISPNCEVLAVNVELSRQTSNISIEGYNILLTFAIFLLILNVKHTKYY